MFRVNASPSPSSMSSKSPINSITKLPSLHEIGSSKALSPILKPLLSTPKVFNYLGSLNQNTNFDTAVSSPNSKPQSRASISPLSTTMEASRKFVSFSMRSMSRLDLTEENCLRKSKVETLLQEIMRFDTSSVHEKPVDSTIFYSKEQVRRRKNEAQRRIFSLFEQILCLYELKFKIVIDSYSDSFLEVDKVEDHFAMIEYIQILAPVICKFPYSFLRRVGFPIITFCQDYFVHQPGHNFGEARILTRGLFPLSKFDTAEKMIDHFMQILYLNIKNMTPDFEAKMQKIDQERPRKTTQKSLLISPTTSRARLVRKKLPGDKEWFILKTLIMKPNQALTHDNQAFQQKAQLFKGFIEEIDPEGIDNAWWGKLELTLILPSIHL